MQKHNQNPQQKIHADRNRNINLLNLTLEY